LKRLKISILENCPTAPKKTKNPYIEVPESSKNNSDPYPEVPSNKEEL